MKYLKALVERLYEIAIKYPLMIAATVFLAVGAIVMALSGNSVQIGGLLEKMFGKKKTDPNIRVVSPVGRPLLPGESDKKGFVQAPVSTQILEPGVFSNPDTITVIHPDKGQITIPLPVGVKNSDVAEVTEIQPDVYQIKNNDSKTDTSKLRDALK